MKPYKRKEIIGDCTLYLGDCLKIMPVLDPVDHVFTDPPYESFMHKSKAGGKKTIRNDGRDEIKALDFASIEEIRQETADMIAEICEGWSLIFCTPEGVGRWADAINQTTAKYKRACTWVKPDCTPQLNGQGPAMGSEEFVLSWCASDPDFMKFIASWCGTGFARWNAGGKRGVYTHNTNSKDRHGEHPTEKPWRLFRELLLDFTNEGQTILDPFMGSGTTGVACAKLGRKFIGAELGEKYFDIACERIRKAYDQPDLFVEPPKKELQKGFDL